MAKVLDDAEFWLPSQFLTDDEFGFGLNSPVESVVGSTETDSDEEDYLAELTRLMAHSTLRNNHAFASQYSKGRVLPSSPQSTLCALRSGCSCKQGPHGSFNCQSRVSSPLGRWDYAAVAGEVASMRENRESSYGGFTNRGLLGPPARKAIDVSGFYPSHRSLSHRNLQASQVQQLKQQQLMKQLKHQHQYQQNYSHVFQNKGRNSNNNRPLGMSPSAWPPLQPQNGSGMRAVFLGNPNGKKECTGTGVFLPSHIGTPSESNKKPACSTVLLPARVVQALNLNLDEIGARPNLHPGFNTSFTADNNAAALKLRSGGTGNVFSSKKQHNSRPHQGINREVQLPQDWTY
ncbi:hypothetical protein Gohar_014364 [Gossypium harknessii]|uniref:TIP41-like protein n=1 Tax=Gossypium harknessii TaxID=34285 RepID=A0A7J9H3N1_9ROSI|nr:hypothetical protein [Gossypium harknessii]